MFCQQHIRQDHCGQGVAGKVLRAYLQENYQMVQYTDLTAVTVFDEATTYPIILLLKKTLPENATIEYKKIEPTFYEKKVSVYALATKLQVPQNALEPSGWNFINAQETELINKLRKLTNIASLFGKCYRGILTGLNEAFIVEKDFGKKENVKPIFEGKDIKKWVSPKCTKNIIIFKSKSTIETFGNLPEDAAKLKMQKKHATLFKHLEPFAEKAKSRTDKGQYWWELRNCAYYDFFQVPKIIFPNLQNRNKFSYDATGAYINAPAVFLPTNEKYLLAILNSKVVWYFLTSICVVRNGGFIEVKPQYFEQIPIPEINEAQKTKLTNKVDQIFEAIESNKPKVVAKLEKEVDQLVYKLYGLTGEEIIVIEALL